MNFLNLSVKVESDNRKLINNPSAYLTKFSQGFRLFDWSMCFPSGTVFHYAINPLNFFTDQNHFTFMIKKGTKSHMIRANLRVT